MIRKGLDGPKVRKTDRELFLSADQVKHLLKTIRESGHKFADRDHAMVFLGLMLGLRCGEVRLLKREDFTHVERGLAEISTLKCAVRVPYRCSHCHRRCRVAAVRAGGSYPCPRCGTENAVARPREANPSPRRSPPIVENSTREYIKRYISSLSPRQTYFFENARGQPLSVAWVRSIFNYWVIQAGLPPVISFHALRHGRGVMVWSASKDIELVRRSLRQTSLGSAQKYVHLSEAATREYQDTLERQNILEDDDE